MIVEHGSLKMDKEIEKKPWRDGNYKSIEGGSAVTIHGEKMTVDGTSFESTLSFGNFGEADPKISEITGEQYYNVESRIDIMGEEMVDFAVLVEHGMKLVFKGRSGDRVRTLVWISEEEFNKECDAREPLQGGARAEGETSLDIGTSRCREVYVCSAVEQGARLCLLRGRLLPQHEEPIHPSACGKSKLGPVSTKKAVRERKS